MNHKPVKPTGPYHDFWIFAEGSRAYPEYDDLLGRTDAPVRISDDILRYFHDLFHWLPTINPSWPNGGKAGSGFNFYGPTIINQEGGEGFAHILCQLIELYQIAPDPVHFTGGWTCEDSENHLETGHYEILEVDKAWLTTTLTTLHEMAQQVASGSHFLLHFGI